jgi:hypothetical protein
MNRDVKQWVKDCQTCSRAKVTRQPAAALQPIPVPRQRFSHIHVDIVGPLPVSKEGFRYLFTIIDRSSRMLEAVPLTNVETETCRDALISQWVARFGVPALLTSDQGAQFTSALANTAADYFFEEDVTAAYGQAVYKADRFKVLAGLRWEDENLQWKGISLAEKVGHDPREVPVTPFVESLITALPRRNEWVFPSLRQLSGDEKNAERRARYHGAKGQKPTPMTVVENSASGRISDPSIAHRRACAAAGLEGLTLQGLRRSFASLCEWLDIPGGISAQIQGHRPQGVREQNYIRRPLDLLRLHHTRIEAWILEQAGVPVPAPLATKTLKAVSNP